ncbi:MAG: hypothetical protein ACJ8F4_03250 [Sphingomonas sp.]
MPGIAVFLIAAGTLEAGLKRTIVELLEDQGHEALLVTDLDGAQASAAAQLFHWSETPGAAVITIDLLPMSLEGEDHRRYRAFDNPKIPKALERARHLVETIAPEKQGDAIDSTRNTDQAWQAVRELLPDREAQLRAAAKRHRDDFATQGAIKDLTREGRRAKVELVAFEGELAIRKTYRASALRFMEREVEVLQRLAPKRPELPRLLERGRNFIIISFVGEGRDIDLEHRGTGPAPLPLDLVRALADFIKACVNEGFDPIDIRAPGNVMMTQSGLKVIDFELWRHCSPGTRPQNALCFAGVPAGDPERPRGVAAFSKPYSNAWYPLTLLPLDSFLYDPPSLQRLKRAGNLLRSWGDRGARALGRRVRPPTRNPRYIPAKLGVAGVIAELNRRRIRYVVLRWHEYLPDLPPGGDIDLLVHDDDIGEVDEILDTKNGVEECDVYSVSGLPGSAHSGVPHLPPEKAVQILESATFFREIYRVPAKADYFFSLAFHSVYHKGYKTGLPSRIPPRAAVPEPKNDYRDTLSRLAGELRLDVDLSLEGLERFLVSNGWGATPEMLAALARRNAWIAAQAAETRS